MRIIMRMRMRRLALAAAAALVIPGLVIVDPASASACDLNNHCYGETFSSPSGIDGVASYIWPNCLNISSGNFITDELWLASSGNAYWVEAGFLSEGSGLNIGGITTAGNYYFWGDNRPGGGFHNHALLTNPSLADTYVAIYKTAANTYIASVGNYSGTSTSNTMTPSTGIWGSETTANSRAHSYGAWSGVEYRWGGGWSTGTGGNGSNTIANPPNTFQWVTQTDHFTAGGYCNN